MQTMDIFEDYDSFRREYFELIKKLVEKKSKTIQRFAPVFLVVNYLYEKNLKKKLTEDEYVFFSTGFDYIFDEFHMINTLYELKFNKDIDELEKYSDDLMEKPRIVLLNKIDVEGAFERAVELADKIRADVMSVHNGHLIP